MGLSVCSEQTPEYFTLKSMLDVTSVGGMGSTGLQASLSLNQMRKLGFRGTKQS